MASTPPPIKGNVVEFKENGNIVLAGKVISASEFGNGLKRSKNDDDTMSVSDLSVDDCSQQPPKALPASATDAKRHKKEKLRLPAGDLRLTFTTKYMQAVNTGDPPTIVAMLREKAVPSIVFVSRHKAPNPNSYAPTHYEIVGPEAIASATEQFLLAIPDATTDIVSEQIHLYANGESSIECEMLVTGTKVFELTGLPQGADKVVLSSGSSSATGIISNIRHEGVDSAAPVAFGVGAMQQKMAICYTTRMTFHLNSEHRVFLIMSEKE